MRTLLCRRIYQVDTSKGISMSISSEGWCEESSSKILWRSEELFLSRILFQIFFVRCVFRIFAEFSHLYIDFFKDDLFVRFKTVYDYLVFSFNG